MRFDIAKSLNGDTITYIARDTNGTVRLREDSLEKIQEAIKVYNEQLLLQAQIIEKGAKKDTSKEIDSSTKTLQATKNIAEEKNSENAIHIPETVPPTPVPDNEESQNVFTHSEPESTPEEKKKKTNKKSFWEKLK